MSSTEPGGSMWSLLRITMLLTLPKGARPGLIPWHLFPLVVSYYLKGRYILRKIPVFSSVKSIGEEFLLWSRGRMAV